jgi:amino acid transporter
MGDALSQLISGALVMGYFVAGLYFLRFWRDTRDRLFGIFAAAFWLLAAQRAALALTVDPTGEQLLLYSVRLLAFVLILAAIIDKNRGGD